MYKYILHKLLYGFLVLLGVILVVFTLFNILPVDPARLTLGQRADVESVEAINKELGLDKPKSVQFFLYLNDLSPVSIYANTDQAQKKYNYLKLIPFGENILVLKKPYLRRSFQTKEDVITKLLSKFPSTLLLAISSIILAILIGIPLGIFAALKHNSWFDNLAMSISVLGISVPSYVSAMLLSFLFGYLWNRYTGLEQTGSLFMIDDYGNDVLVLKNLILPTIALGTRPVAIIFQLTRSTMLDILSHDYIRTARAKGLTERWVIFKHALRNALNPVVTSISGWFASLLAGAYFVEMIFNIDGIGSMTVNALQTFDFPVVMGSVLFTASIFVCMNIFVDILYGILDPRIRLAK